MLLSYKYRIEPNCTQAAALSDMLRSFCDLYNVGLQQRIEAYRRCGKSLRYADQANELKAVRIADDRLAGFSFSAEQQVLRRLDKAFQAFFRRVKQGRKPGFPRFRSRHRYHAADFRVGDGMTIRKSGKIGFVGVPGEVKVRWHRALPSAPKSAILTRQIGKWYVVFHVEVDATEQANDLTVGVDVGLTSLVALSTGDIVARPNWTKRAAKGLRRRQRALARCRRGSHIRANRRTALARFQARIANRRRDNLHKLSSDLVNCFGRIAVEDLNIRGLARGMHAKHVNDAAWAQLVSMLDYKAANAGSPIVKVDPRGTSQICPECGTIAAKTLAERMHRCDCGCTLDRDVAAAMVVHFRAFGFWPGAGREESSEPVAA